jgi:hypothetical protein
MVAKFVSWFRLLVTDLLPWKSGFAPRSIHVGFTMDKVELGSRRSSVSIVSDYGLDQWYSTFFFRVPPDIISLHLCTPKVVGT